MSTIQYFNVLICFLFVVNFIENKLVIIMTRKQVLFFSSLFFLANASQNTAQGATFIAGLQGGYGHGHADTTSDYESQTGHTVPAERNLGVRGPFAGLFIGCDFNIKNAFFMGVEINGFLASLKASETVTNTSIPNSTTDIIKQKLKSSIDALLKLGCQLDSIALYLKVGPSYGRWRFKSTLSDIPIKYSKTKGLFGVKVAFGIEGNIVKNLIWGVEYNHTFLQSYTFQRPFDATNVTPHRVKPNYGAVLVRLMYKFK